MNEIVEKERIAALSHLDILDTGPESQFDDLTELAARRCRTPMALISLVDGDRLWFKSGYGCDPGQVQRAASFCDQAIRSDAVLVVLDALADARFRDHPEVRAEPGLRFYAGAPLVTPDGHRIGAICVLDFAPREAFGVEMQQSLRTLAGSVMQALIQRAAARHNQQLASAAAETRELLALAEQTAQVGTWALDVASGDLTWSDETFRIYGLDPSGPAPSRAELLDLYRPDDAARLAALADRSVREATGYQHQAQITRPDGVVRHISSRGFHRCDASGTVVALYGTVEDVTALKLADTALRDNEARLRTLNWALTAYARATSTLLHSADAESVVASVCEAIVEGDTYALACVALAEPLPSKAIKVIAGAGRATEYLDDLTLSWADDVPEGRGPTGLAIRSGRPQVMRDTLIDPRYGPWREKGLSFGIRSSVTVPFSHGDRVLGVLIVYAERPDAFGPQEMTLFQQLAEELAFAISLEADRILLANSRQAQKCAEDAEAATRRELEDSEARFRVIAERVHDLIMRYDRHGIIEYISPSVRQFGYEPQDLIGRSAAALAGPQHGGRTLADLDAYAQGRPFPEAERTESQARCADGRMVWLEGTASAVYDASGAFAGVVTVMRDITERRAIEAELEHKRAEAEAASVAKAEFLANMSHEIRTPLTGVLGFAGLLKELPDLPDRAAAYVERITTGGEALLAIVNDILDFSRLEAGKVELDAQPIALDSFLRATLDLVASEAARRGLTLRLDCAPDLPAVVRGDSARLRQILLNLIGNALKFTLAGSVTLTVAADGGDRDRLRFAVRDTGVGISPEHAGRLFLRFSQVDASNTRAFGGTGLGLAICKGLTEMMGGQIGVDSAPGRGSTFWFSIAAPALAMGGRVPRPEAEHWRLPPMKILAVDDVAVNRELVAALLSPFDIEIVEAVDGLQAVEACLRTRFDLILMDLQMPRMDGLAATEAIRANCDLNRATPILALSANVMPPQVEACRRAGMNDHIGKPIDPSILLGKIAQWAEARPVDAGA